MAAATATSTSDSPGPSTSNNSKPTLLYKFKITLNEYYHRPRGGRWRRVVVPANFSLLELHVVIQVVFGWENYHLHHFFRNRNSRFPDEHIEYVIKDKYNASFLPEESKEERIYKVSEVFSEEKPVLEYEYDFGACWGHEVKFEGVVEPDPKLDYPACIQGILFIILFIYLFILLTYCLYLYYFYLSLNLFILCALFKLFLRLRLTFKLPLKMCLLFIVV